MHQRVMLQLQRTVTEGVPYESLPQALRKAAPYSEWQELCALSYLQLEYAQTCLFWLALEKLDSTASNTRTCTQPFCQCLLGPTGHRQPPRQPLRRPRTCRVKMVYIHKSWPWSNLACMAGSEVDYYEQLLRTFRHKQRLFPYHLAGAVCGKLRVTPFKYYFDVVFQAMRNEMPYDKIPNFTAAEILQLLGIGRNEYIAKLNACSERKLLWRVNRSIAKEYLPTEPTSSKMLDWWRIHAVSISAPAATSRAGGTRRLRCCHIPASQIADVACSHKKMLRAYSRR